MIMDKIK